MRGRDEDAEWTALGDTQESGTLRSHRLHDGQDIVHLLLEGRKSPDTVGQPRAALVQHDQPGERCQPFEKSSVGGLFPLSLDVAEEAAEKHEIDRGIAKYLIGNVRLAALRI